MFYKELSDDNLNEIFTSISNKTLSVETKDIEYKKSYGFGSLSEYMKTMAAFANASGGYIIFGVIDKTCELIGLNGEGLLQFKKIDNARITENLKNQFDYEITWDKRSYIWDDLEFGIIYVLESPHKPIISLKDRDQKLRKSAIYFRYNSQSTEINPADLHKLIELEKNRLVFELIDKIQLIGKIGVDNSHIINTVTGDISDLTKSPSNIIIEPETLKQIKFIKEGEFTEKEGSPALILKGTIQDIRVNEKYVLKAGKPIAILQNHIFDNFLTETSIDNPIEYLKIISNAKTANYPIFYYIKDIPNKDDIINELSNVQIIGSRRTLDNLIQRLSYNTGTHYKPIHAKGNVADIKKKYLRNITSNKIEIPSYQNDNGKNLRYFLQAIQAVKQDFVIKNKKYLLDNLNVIYNSVIVSENCSSEVKTEFRKAICWIDEALYSRKI